MKYELILTAALFALSVPDGEVVAQIYRCETDEGPVFSDTECGAEAVVVELQDDSRGISMGPPEDVRTELEETREQWAEELAAQREAQQAARARAQPPSPVIVERQVALPVWGWGAPGYGRPPGYRPRPPYRPEPLPPVAPPIRPPMRPPPVMRPPR